MSWRHFFGYTNEATYVRTDNPEGQCFRTKWPEVIG